MAQEFQNRYGQVNTYMGLTGQFTLKPANHIKESKGYVDFSKSNLNIMVEGLSFGLFGLSGYSKGSHHFTSAQVLFNLDEAGRQKNMCQSLYSCVENASDANEINLLVSKYSHLNCYAK